MLASLLPRNGERSFPSMSFDQYAKLLTSLNIGGHRYPAGASWTKRLYEDAYEHSGPVGALIFVRQMVFSDVRFMWQQLRDGRPGNLFGDQALSILERPWPNGSTGGLLRAMEVDGSLAGNSYWIRERSWLRSNEEVLTRLDPANTVIMTGDTRSDQGRRYGRFLAGYGYQESFGDDMTLFAPDEVAHFKPLASPDMPEFKGMSWLTPILEDVNADSQMTSYKTAFLRNSAVPNLAVTLAPDVGPDQLAAFKKAMDSSHNGVPNAFKTLYLGGGADVKVVGQSFDQLNLKAVQGAGETRLAAAAGVPTTVVGFSEGQQGSSLNAGNYVAARRRMADGTIRPLWSEACSALGAIVQPRNQFTNGAARLWYDERVCSFLQEDVKDAADIKQTEASTLRQLLEAGFTSDSSVEAVRTGDWSVLVHTGLFSIQLQPPGSSTAPDSQE